MSFTIIFIVFVKDIVNYGLCQDLATTDYFSRQSTVFTLM